MSLCINPRCNQPDHPGNDGTRFCQSCGSQLILQERYRVMRLLSDKSGFGSVYDAYERNIPKLLKVLKEGHSKNSKAIELFEQEAVVLSQLHHPGIPAVELGGCFQFFPRGSSEPLYCIVMEKIDGPNLREWMKQQGYHPISEKQTLNWLEQLVEILHLVHQKNYFHRDIKPENIMLRSSGQLVLVDFGAAREMTYTYLAQLGSTGGVTKISSAGYTPPEQEKGQAVPQSDFYALGWTFIYLLTGKQPTDASIYDSFHNTFNWRSAAPHISPPLADFIDRLIAPRAADRPKNTDEILQLLHALTRSPSRSISPSPTSQNPIYATVVNPVTIPQTTTGTKPKPSRSWWLGAAAIVAIALGGLSVWQLQQRLASVTPVTLIENLQGHTSFINTLAITPDGRFLISGSADSSIRLWEIATGQEIRRFSHETGFVNTLAINPDGQTLVSGDANSKIIIWNLATGENLLTLESNSGYINALVISPDGQTLISGGADGIIRVWNLKTGEQLFTLTGHTNFINTLAISPDGQTLVSGGADNIIHTWNLTTRQPLHQLPGHTGYVNALVISPDGQMLISASADKSIRVWQLATGEKLATLTGHDSFVNSLAISSDGQTLVSSSADKTIKLWDLRTGEVTRTLKAEDASLEYFVVSPDWRIIATGKGDNVIRLWQFQP